VSKVSRDFDDLLDRLSRLPILILSEVTSNNLNARLKELGYLLGKLERDILRAPHNLNAWHAEYPVEKIEHLGILLEHLKIILELASQAKISRLDEPVREKLHKAAEPIHPGRYVNLFFSDPSDTAPLAADKPLICGQPYTLHVHIGLERKGLSDDQTPFPDNALQDQWDERSILPITVIVSSRDFNIANRVETLQLPREGLSSEVTFTVTPCLPQEGQGFIQIDLLYRGHILQSKRVEAAVVSAAHKLAPVSQRPLQRAVTTFTTIEQLDKKTLESFPMRVLTINVEKDERDGSLDVRFLDRTQGEEVAFYDTLLQPEALGKAISNLRDALRGCVKRSMEVQVDGASVESWQYRSWLRWSR
jgi:hypothetical protein